MYRPCHSLTVLSSFHVAMNTEFDIQVVVLACSSRVRGRESGLDREAAEPLRGDGGSRRNARRGLRAVAFAISFAFTCVIQLARVKGQGLAPGPVGKVDDSPAAASAGGRKEDFIKPSRPRFRKRGCCNSNSGWTPASTRRSSETSRRPRSGCGSRPPAE